MALIKQFHVPRTHQYTITFLIILIITTKNVRSGFIFSVVTGVHCCHFVQWPRCTAATSCSDDGALLPRRAVTTVHCCHVVQWPWYTAATSCSDHGALLPRRAVTTVHCATSCTDRFALLPRRVVTAVHCCHVVQWSRCTAATSCSDRGALLPRRAVITMQFCYVTLMLHRNCQLC